MAEQLYSVELTDSFIERLASIEAFLEEADAAFAYDDLLSGLRSTVIPNLARFPLIDKRYMDQPPQSAEALAQLAQLPHGAADALRVYLHSNDLILYAVACCQVDCIFAVHPAPLPTVFRLRAALAWRIKGRII